MFNSYIGKDLIIKFKKGLEPECDRKWFDYKAIIIGASDGFLEADVVLYFMNADKTNTEPRTKRMLINLDTIMHITESSKGRSA